MTQPSANCPPQTLVTVTISDPTDSSARPSSALHPAVERRSEPTPCLHAEFLWQSGFVRRAFRLHRCRGEVSSLRERSQRTVPENGNTKESPRASQCP